MRYFLYYICAINIFSFLVYAFDKLEAKLDHRRISEGTLLFLSLIGGPLGSILSMYIFRHKTKKKYFIIWNIVFLLAYIIVVVEMIKTYGVK